jgi:SsrA-binding protein
MKVPALCMELNTSNRNVCGVARKRPRERTSISCSHRVWSLTVMMLMYQSLLYLRQPIVDGFRLLLPESPQNSVFHRGRICLFAKSGTKKKKKGPGSNTVAVNRIAYRNYEVLDTFEAGISLLGTEVKSIRDGKLNLRDGYVKPAKNGRSCTLHNVHVGKCQYVGAEYFQHEEKRPRSLLLHRSEARKLLQQTEQLGMTVIPLKAYWNEQNKLKIQIALCRGKNVRDKRATIQERDMKRETNRIIKNFRIA